ncbi:putative peroxisomal membrane protein [Xylariaceae sp. FL0016]|nr:putative peroxisomal membrane protein [Xylariaceae sp. FL0016]
MAPLKAGDAFPSDVKFSYVVPTPDTADVLACGMPVPYDASKEFADKKVVLVAVPGAFTPTCQNTHITGYLAKLADLKSKGVDRVICIAYNDAFVMSAWGKANGIKDDSVLFMSDDGTKFSQSIGWTMLPDAPRTSRYAMIIDHGKVVYAEKEPAKGVTVSGVDDVLAKL